MFRTKAHVFVVLHKFDPVEFGFTLQVYKELFMSRMHPVIISVGCISLYFIFMGVSESDELKSWNALSMTLFMGLFSGTKCSGYFG